MKNGITIDPQVEGDEISIYEWPSGCELCNDKRNESILIRSPKDAEIIIDSLCRYLETFNEV
jgi:hypothetical protein